LAQILDGVGSPFLSRASSAGDPFMAESICFGVCRTDNEALAMLFSRSPSIKLALHNRVLIAKLGRHK
jgi:hypothetical protein